VGATPTPATNLNPKSEGSIKSHLREVIRLPDCKSGVRKQSRK
jgi:hypothetical protein